MKHQILYKINNTYTFRFLNYIEESISIVSKNAVMFLGFAWFTAVVSILLPIVPLIGGIFHTFFLVPMFTAGYFLVAHKLKQREHVTFFDFFGGFDKIKSLALINLTIYIFIFFSFITAMHFMIEVDDISSLIPSILNATSLLSIDYILRSSIFYYIVFFLILIPMLLYSIFILSTPLLLFENIDFWTAMKTSKRLTFKKIYYPFVVLLLACVLFYGLYILLFKAMAYDFYILFLKNSASETSIDKIKNVFFPKTNIIFSLIMVQLVPALVTYSLFPFFYNIIYAWYADISSNNDIDTEYFDERQ